MMRYLYISLLALLFASCEDITVGYLDAENATYGIDSLVVNKVAIAKIDKDISDNSETYYSDLVKEFEQLLYTNYGNAYNQFDAINLAYLKVIEESKHLFEPSELKKIESYYQDALYSKNEADKENPDLYKNKIWSSFNYAKSRISSYSVNRMKRHADNIPWVTNALQGVEGSYPLRYSIAEIKSVNNSDNAQKMLSLFNDIEAEKYTGIRGNGSIQVPYRTTLPNDIYLIDVRIRNEDREYVQKEILKIIVK